MSGDGHGAREPERGAAGFDGALARARGAEVERRAAPSARGVDARRLAVRTDPGSASRLGSPDGGAPPRDPPPTELAADPAPVTALAALARALPPTIAAARPADGTLALSFGRSLAVELRSTDGGVELLLRADAGLARAAEAELPRVVAALRVRGVPVARAEVRPRPSGGGRAR